MQTIKNLVLEGGGVKGIAYIGALEILEERGKLAFLERVGGTSAGAITALLVGLGHTNFEIQRLLWEVDFAEFLDSDIGLFRDTSRLLNDFGWYKGDFFRGWIGGVVEDITGDSNTTFADIEVAKQRCGYKSMYFVGTNLSTRSQVVFSAETTPDMPIADAVRISMSIPFMFAAPRIDGDVFCDGGVVNNFPIRLFDCEKYFHDQDYLAKLRHAHDGNNSPDHHITNPETLGLKIDNKQELAAFRDDQELTAADVDDFFAFTSALLSTLLDAQQNVHLNDADWQRTVFIDALGIKTTEFDLSDERKQMLIESGRKGALHYLNNASATSAG